MKNNYVFTLAEAGRLDQAEALHARIRGECAAGDARIVWLANFGLLAYRRGRHQEGRALYQQAAELADEMKRPALGRIARAYWIGEELRAAPPGHEDGVEVDQVLGQAREQATPDLRIAIVRLERIRAKQRERAAI